MLLYQYDYIAFKEHIFNDSEINAIHKYAEGLPYRKGTVIQESGINNNWEIILSEDIRKNNIKWLHNDEKLWWMWDKIYATIHEINNKFFHFDIGFCDPLQYSTYTAPGDKYGGHSDLQLSTYPHRKISFSIQLTDEESYEGGDLLIYSHSFDNPVRALRKKGSITVFASIIMHEVTPVTSGTRNSLVGWISGPPLK